MITTTKYGLKKPEATDSADLRIFVGDNMDILDGHGHDWADITTGKPTTFPPPLMRADAIGGARVGNGLTMSGEYLLVRTGSGLEINPTTYSVDIDRDITNTWYAPTDHDHVWADITDAPTTMTPPLMTTDLVGGARVGNGLGMSGEYLFVRTGTGLVIDPTMLNVAIDRTVTDPWYAPADHDHLWEDITDKPLVIVSDSTGGTGTITKVWSGTQAQYDGITRNAETLYYIIG
jgi:hypothetical protein